MNGSKLIVAGRLIDADGMSVDNYLPPGRLLEAYDTVSGINVYKLEQLGCISLTR